MTAERLLEERALRISELAGELVAKTNSGSDLNERKSTLMEIRRQLEALDAQATSLSVQLNGGF